MANVLNELRMARRAELRHGARARRLILRASEAGHTHAEIAAVLGVSRQAVSEYLRRREVASERN